MMASQIKLLQDEDLDKVLQEGVDLILLNIVNRGRCSNSYK